MFKWQIVRDLGAEGYMLTKKKKFKEKEKCGETAVSVTNGYGRFSVYMFL